MLALLMLCLVLCSALTALVVPLVIRHHQLTLQVADLTERMQNIESVVVTSVFGQRWRELIADEAPDDQDVDELDVDVTRVQ